MSSGKVLELNMSFIEVGFISYLGLNVFSVQYNPQNAQARQNMLKASYLAGVAFTKSYVGYVHAIAHTLGGAYGVAHGLANAIILPVVLREYGTAVHKKLAIFARHINIATQEETDEQASNKFINWIERLNSYFDIPTKIEQIKQEDIVKLAKIADTEANPLYPVPKLWGKAELEKIYKMLSVND